MAQIVTITNPLTGQPAQVDQLDHTAQQIDDGIGRALPGGAIDLALSSKVSKSGDTMTGGLNINANYAALILRDADGSNNPIGEFEHYNGISKIGSTQNGRSRELHIRSDSISPNIADAMALYDSGSDSWYNIHHTGNKPSGSYTGNGSATKRTIDTGGTGDICLVWGYTYASIVTPYGTLSRYYNDETPVNLKMSQMSFEKGVLTIATDNPVCNYNTATYYYQVL